MYLNKKSKAQNFYHIAVISNYVSSFKNYVYSKIQGHSRTRILKDNNTNIVTSNNKMYHCITDEWSAMGKRFHEIQVDIQPNDVLTYRLERAYNAAKINLYEYTPLDCCELCGRINGNNRVNKVFYNPQNNVELEKGTITKISNVMLNDIDTGKSYNFPLCQGCQFRIIINETEYITKAVIVKRRFKRKNEAITDAFLRVEIKQPEKIEYNPSLLHYLDAIDNYISKAFTPLGFKVGTTISKGSHCIDYDKLKLV